jgi:hypothetical protein
VVIGSNSIPESSIILKIDSKTVFKTNRPNECFMPISQYVAGSTLNLMEDSKLCQKSEDRRPKLKRIKGQSRSKEH